MQIKKKGQADMKELKECEVCGRYTRHEWWFGVKTVFACEHHDLDEVEYRCDTRGY